jgi:hypothetical protein
MSGSSLFSARPIFSFSLGGAGAALQFNQTIQLRNTERKGQSFADVLWKRIFCERRYLNLTATGAADTVAANCAAQGFSRGLHRIRTRSSWSSREHRLSDHPAPYYGMRKPKFRKGLKRRIESERSVHLFEPGTQNHRRSDLPCRFSLDTDLSCL